MPVNLGVEEMRRVVEKTNGCIVWGGTLSLAPADDAFIHVEYPLSIDPLMLASIMSKKKAVGAEYLVIDIPTGRGTKMKTIGEADLLSKDFIELGRKLNIKTECVLTYGEQPVGKNIGAGLETREALEILMRKSNVPDVFDKVVHVAGTLMDMVGLKNGEDMAREIIRSGKAEKKLREIIYHQGGDSEIKPDEIEIGQYGVDITSEENGSVLWIDNAALVSVARAAGSPKDKRSGIVLNKKLGDHVKKGDLLFTIYSDKTTKLSAAEKEVSEGDIFGVADKREMMIHTVRELPKPSKRFILER
jgi:AMP phosphorylase